MNLIVLDIFEKFINDIVIVVELREVYNGNIEDVDFLIGLLVEVCFEGFGFGDILFYFFLCMVNCCLKIDRYFNDGVRWGFKFFEMFGGVWKRLIDKIYMCIVNRKEMRIKCYRFLKWFFLSKILNCDWKILVLFFCKICYLWFMRLIVVRFLYYLVVWYKISYVRM